MNQQNGVGEWYEVRSSAQGDRMGRIFGMLAGGVS